MARQVLPIAGAVVGTFFGNPQLGFAIGSIIGNAVDPQTIRAPGLKELPVMGVTEGAYRQVVYGTSVIRDCQLIDWGDIDVVTVKERQGKGGGPVVETKRLYQTYAVGLGEPVQAIRYIKRNGVMVYDVRAGSKILRESTAFAKRFRFYPGSETQLPDPSLEALPRNGVGNTPAYRGSAYFVMIRDDLTDLGGQIPTYEVEVQSAIVGDPVNATLLTNVVAYTGAPDGLAVGQNLLPLWASSTDHVRVSPNGEYAAGVHREGGTHTFRLLKHDALNNAWAVIPTPNNMPASFISALAWSPDSTMLAMTHTGGVSIFVRQGDVFTRQPDPAEQIPVAGFRSLAFDSVGKRLAVGASTSALSLYIYDISGGHLVNRRGFVSPGTNNIGGAPERVEFQPGDKSQYIACGNPTDTFVVRCEKSPIEIAAHVVTNARAGSFWDAGGSHIVAVGDGAVRVYRFVSTAGAEQLTLESTYTTGIPAFVGDATISRDKRFIAMSAVSGGNWPVVVGLSAASPPAVGPTSVPPTAGSGVVSVSFFNSPLPRYADSAVGLSSIVSDICDRCGIPSGKLSLGELTDAVRGVTLGGAYDGAGAITTMMPAFLFDLYEADRKLFAPKRGAAVKSTITASHLIEEPDENTLRGQGIEYPRALQLKYLNPTQDYAAPAATATNKSTNVRVRGEVTVDLPVAFNDSEALNVAARMLKVMWEDVNGEAVFSLPAGPFAWLTPTDTLGLSLRGALYRVRVEKVEQSGGRLKITARRDRQSAYTSNLTAIPLPAPVGPPPSLAGDTSFVILNTPGIIDGDDVLGIRVAGCGLPGTAWNGYQVELSSDAGATWQVAGTYTRSARMGFLSAALPSAPEHYADVGNTLRVTLLDGRSLLSVTDIQLLQESNGAAIARADGTAELVQFRDVSDAGNRAWTLSYLLRGRLATSTASHAAGARFVMLDGTEFIPLGIQLIGRELRLRVTSLGNSPETAPVYTFTWQPPAMQTEFAPAFLRLTRGGGVISGTWSPRHRFGTDVMPVASVNFDGYRVTLTAGSVTQVLDRLQLSEFSVSDAAFSGAITVTVQQLNRITGPGPGLSEVA